jgi:hypothetical protein
MKKTPASFASAPAHNVAHAIIASAAIVGIANSMVIPAKAATQDTASYDTAAQKLTQNDVRNGYTYGNIQTSSRQGSGGFSYITNDDNNSYTDNN